MVLRRSHGAGHHGFEVVEVDLAGTFTVDAMDHALAVFQGGGVVAQVDEDGVQFVRRDAPVLVQIEHVEGGCELIHHVYAAVMTTSRVEIDKLLQIDEAIPVGVRLLHHQQRLFMRRLVSQRSHHAEQLLRRDLPISVRIKLRERLPHLLQQRRRYIAVGTSGGLYQLLSVADTNVGTRNSQRGWRLRMPSR